MAIVSISSFSWKKVARGSAARDCTLSPARAHRRCRSVRTCALLPWTEAPRTRGRGLAQAPTALSKGWRQCHFFASLELLEYKLWGDRSPSFLSSPPKLALTHRCRAPGRCTVSSYSAKLNCRLNCVDGLNMVLSQRSTVPGVLCMKNGSKVDLSALLASFSNCSTVTVIVYDIWFF